ncbi:hypothetical protein, partial [Burkholderia sp. MSMB1835]|uniref:hypothetical protein n=1 Tax=Burkholderia sp. MSMB1835 TaxID=1637876 RepID=UPI0012E3D5C1
PACAETLELRHFNFAQIRHYNFALTPFKLIICIMLNIGCRPETDYRDTFLPPKLNRIDSIFQAVSPVGDTAEVPFQMAHGSTITALEAYLADTMKFRFNGY